jgi:anti-sigma B factor antagonist
MAMSEPAYVPMVEIVVPHDADGSASRLHALLDEALALNPRELVVDLTSCPLVDAAGIGLLLDAHRRVHGAGGVLTLRSPSSRLRRNLKLARVDSVLRVTPAEPPSTSPPDRTRSGERTQA